MCPSFTVHSYIVYFLTNHYLLFYFFFFFYLFFLTKELSFSYQESKSEGSGGGECIVNDTRWLTLLVAVMGITTGLLKWLLLDYSELVTEQ